MPVHDYVSFLLLDLSPVLGYAGPGVGLELVPYFLGLLAWAGVAFSAVLVWPITALLRHLRKIKAVPGQELKAESAPAMISQSPGEVSQSVT